MSELCVVTPRTNSIPVSWVELEAETNGRASKSAPTATFMLAPILAHEIIVIVRGDCSADVNR